MACPSSPNQHCLPKPAETRTASTRQRFQRAALSNAALGTSSISKLDTTDTTTFCALMRRPQSAWHPNGPNASVSYGCSHMASPHTGSRQYGSTMSDSIHVSTASASSMSLPRLGRLAKALC